MEVIFDGTAHRPMGRYLSSVEETPLMPRVVRSEPPTAPSTASPVRAFTPRRLRSAEAHQRLREALQAKPQTTVELSLALGWSLWKTQSLLGRLRSHGRARVIEQRAVHRPTFGRRIEAVWGAV